MMYLITGQPGNGKTLYALKTIEERRQKENRPVFYHGIPELTIPWLPLEKPEEWYKLPEGSIIVIDECQKTFPPRPSAQKPPIHVSEFETHRHKGFDLYLLTQHPSLVDNHLKRLAGKHYHVIRSFGMQRADVFEMQSVMDPSAKNLKDSLRKQFKYPKEVYAWYKSSDLHTHKRKLPWQYYAIPIALLLLVTLLYFSFRNISGLAKKAPSEAQQVLDVATKPPGINNQFDGPKKVLTKTEYIAAYQPRIEGLEFTAPIYDEVTKPEEAPIPSACLESKSKGCKCYSQQATILKMSQEMCRNIVANGFFQNFTLASQKSRNEKGREGQGGSVVARNEPPSGRTDTDGPRVVESGFSPSIQTIDKPVPTVLSPYVPPGNTSTNPKRNPAMRG